MQSFFNFMISFFHTYDITTEVVMIVLILVLYLIIQCSKPENTYMLKIFRMGMRFSLLTIIFHIAMLGETIKIPTSYNIIPFSVFYLLFSISDTGTLLCLFLYQNNLSYKRRFQIKKTMVMAGIFCAVWLTILILPMVKGLLLNNLDGSFTMSKFSDAYVVCSLLCAIIVGTTSFINRRNVSKIVNFGSLIFIPIEIVAIVFQFYFHTAYFICATFTIPFLIYFILFHTDKYDDITGCQGYAAYKTFIKRCLQNKKDFIQLTVSCPSIESRNNSEIERIAIGECNRFSREIERIDRRLRVYSISTYHYNIICTVKDEFEGEYIKDRLLDLLTEPLQIGNRYIKVAMNFLASKRYEEITSIEDYLRLLKQKEKQFFNLGIDQTIEVTDKDAKAFKRHAFIEKNILDIKYQRNLEDDRVIAFVQPIYNINSGKFKTGECLMRLMIDGEMIFPDEFIPIAERCGCIHSLTRIMLYKAARLSKQLCEHDNFEALTVNVSTIEMAEPNVCEEFYGIFMRAGAKPENIRLEITESTKVIDYRKVTENINQLVSMGINFYLDDFGTGYSNLDRVIGMPFSSIKFDKSLMYKAIEDKKTAQLISFLSNFFKQKGFSLVVEGVETEDQRDYVKKLGFDYIQGYLYSKPVPASDVEKFFC